jgi:hypothetical protein
VAECQWPSGSAHVNGYQCQWPIRLSVAEWLIVSAQVTERKRQWPNASDRVEWQFASEWIPVPVAECYWPSG